MTSYDIPIDVEFDRAHTWTFHADKKGTPDRNGMTRYGERHTVGVLATSFDAAYAAYRSKYPDRRITQIVRNDTVVDLVVDRPEAIAFVKRMGA